MANTLSRKVDLISNSKELSEDQQGSNYGMAVVVPS